MKRVDRSISLGGSTSILRTALLAVAVFVSYCHAQEESLNPGINDNFKDPDIQTNLERFETESREVYNHRNEIVAALSLEEGMEVADIGAGTGFFSRMMARKVGPTGKVYAVEIAAAFLKHINERAEKEAIENIELVLCDQKSTNLPPESIDLAFACDTYHHFEFPYRTLKSIHRALRPDGVLVIVDFERIEGVSREWILGHVRCGKGTVTDEIEDSGFDLVEEVPMLQENYILRFKKRG